MCVLIYRSVTRYKNPGEYKECIKMAGLIETNETLTKIHGKQVNVLPKVSLQKW